jgi:hypothetical protein
VSTFGDTERNPRTFACDGDVAASRAAAGRRSGKKGDFSAEKRSLTVDYTTQ